jgi:hypothetical protein
MSGGRLIRAVFLLLTGPLIAGDAVWGATPIGVIVRLADRLVEEQVPSGDLKGTWPGEEDYTGTIVAGLVRAYQVTCDERYREAAEAGGEFFVGAAQGNFYGDEAYALTLLSEMSGGQADDRWFPIIQTFYADVKDLVVGSTSAYLSEFDRAERSVAVFYLAHHTVSAYYVEAEDKQMWRQALIDSVSDIDDSSAAFPVTALGVATWALAVTGPLDDSPMDPSSEGAIYWREKRLSDLPDILMDHQVGEDGVLPGTFYWRFDHSDGASGGPVSGYTEDLVFATLGLLAVAHADPNHRLEAAIDAARTALLSSLSWVDTAYQHLWLLGGNERLYTGEALQAAAELVPVGDLNLDGKVNNVDFSAWARYWRETGCLDYCRCSRADLSQNSEVDYQDLSILAGKWMK